MFQTHNGYIQTPERFANSLIALLFQAHEGTSRPAASSNSPITSLFQAHNEYIQTTSKASMRGMSPSFQARKGTSRPTSARNWSRNVHFSSPQWVRPDPRSRAGRPSGTTSFKPARVHPDPGPKLKLIRLPIVSSPQGYIQTWVAPRTACWFSLFQARKGTSRPRTGYLIAVVVRVSSPQGYIQTSVAPPAAPTEATFQARKGTSRPTDPGRRIQPFAVFQARKGTSRPVATIFLQSSIPSFKPARVHPDLSGITPHKYKGRFKPARVHPDPLLSRFDLIWAMVSSPQGYIQTTISGWARRCARSFKPARVHPDR